MSGDKRREKMLVVLRQAHKPVSGSDLARQFGVSRQVIVQDIALLRAKDQQIISTCRGYLLEQSNCCQRIFKVHHTDEQMEEELQLFVDFGGKVEDEFVYHKIYDVIRVELGIRSRRDVKQYLETLKNGKSTSLKDVTSGYHYHTVSAESEEVLDRIQEELGKKGFLAQLTEYEPVDF